MMTDDPTLLPPRPLSDRPLKRRSASRWWRWWRQRPGATCGAAVGLALVVAVGWYLVSPLFLRTRLEEAGAAGRAEVLASGTFSDRDAVHRGAGRASLARTAGGQTQLRLDAFRVTNGPDLYVFLTPASAPATHEDVTRDALNLGRLKASEGTFSYELPVGVDPARFGAAVIYCSQFRTIFSVAPLTSG
jgi:hypothetical protein